MMMHHVRTLNMLLIAVAIIILLHSTYTIVRDVVKEHQAKQLEWQLLNEPDPLTVERVQGDSRKSVCVNRDYEFRRIVKAKKNLDIYVQERWHSIDGDLNVGAIDGEIVLAKPIHYPLDAGFEKVMTFKKTVPDSVGKGRWEYRPIATYVINEKKRITRPLPTQLVDVDCDPKEVK